MKSRLGGFVGRVLVAAALIVPSFAVVAGVGALSHSQGLPLVTSDLDATAASGGITLSFPSAPITSAGAIGPSGTVSWTARTKNNGAVAPGVTVYLCQCLESANIADSVAGDSTTVPASQCGGTGQLPLDGSLLQCVTDSGGAIVLTYHAPANPPAQGRADWVGQLNSSPATKAKAQTHYVYDTQLRFAHSPIATPGSLSAGASVPITLSSENGLDQGIAGSTVYLSFKPATGGGSASVGATKLTGAPHLFTTASNGTLSITYTAPAHLPASGIDTLTVQDLAKSPQEVNTDSYAFAASTPVISIGDVNVVEGDQDPGAPAEFTVTVSPVQSTATTVQYITLCGVGDKGCGEDFVQVNKAVTVTIPANTSSTTILVRQFNYLGGKDDAGTGGETYNEGWYVLISKPSSGVLGRSIGEGILLPDIEGSSTPLADLYVGDVGLMPVHDPAGDPTSMQFCVTLGAKLTTAVTFNYATGNGTAIAGTDYTATLGVATIAAGKTSVLITVTVLPGSPPSANKTFTFTISNGSGGHAIGRAKGIGTILAS